MAYNQPNWYDTYAISRPKLDYCSLQRHLFVIFIFKFEPTLEATGLCVQVHLPMQDSLAENEANPGFLELIFIFREKIKLIWDEIETL